jgi:rare lipoprotein A
VIGGAPRRALTLAALLLAPVWTAACARESGLRPLQRPAAGPADDGVAPATASSSTGCSTAELTQPGRQPFEGRASYYHDSLAGNRTASGQRYQIDKLTAAHRTLPFGTRLRLVRTDGAGSPTLCVTVNDRGPFAGRRVLDLSRRAAEALDMIRAGVVPIKAEVVGKP